MCFISLSQSNPRALKPYKCCWCHELIVVGEKHHHYTGKFWGEFQNSRMHTECKEAMHAMPRQDIEDGFEPGGFERGTMFERGSDEGKAARAALPLRNP